MKLDKAYEIITEPSDKPKYNLPFGSLVHRVNTRKQNEYEAYLKYIYNHNGDMAQIDKTIEELQELIVELEKCKRDNALDYRLSLIEEMADVHVMLDHLVLRLKCYEDMVETQYWKAHREVGRIKGICCDACKWYADNSVCTNSDSHMRAAFVGREDWCGEFTKYEIGG